MAHHIIEFDQQCKDCNGTGIYIGLAERDGVGVVCRRCKGIGHHKVSIEYDDFEGLTPRANIKRIVRTNPGIVIGESEKDNLSLDDFGGMPYSDWLIGKPFPSGSEDRKHTCPAWFYQSADCTKKPNWASCGWGYFGDCKNFCRKDECWARWDKEFGSAEAQSECDERNGEKPNA